MVVLDELTIADAPEPWRACGFDVEGDVCVVGETRIRLAGAGAGRGLSGWSLRGVGADADLDGLATTISDRPPPSEGPVHPNGVAGARPRRRDLAGARSHGRRARGRRPGSPPSPRGADAGGRAAPGVLPARGVILEVVQEPDEAIEKAGGVERPAFFWGLAFLAPDLDAAVATLGERVSEARDAVQPGRRIATLRRSAGLSVPVALMTP